MVKYYTIAFPGEFDQHVRETWSEEQIIKSYYTYWSTKMIQNVDNPDLTKENCISDWCTVHWAQETDEFGTPVDYLLIPPEDNIMHGATLMSDKGYRESTHERQAEFAAKRNEGFYDVGNMSLDEIKRRGRE